MVWIMYGATHLHCDRNRNGNVIKEDPRQRVFFIESAVFIFSICKKILSEQPSAAESDKIFAAVQKKLECRQILQYSYFVRTNTKVHRDDVLDKKGRKQ